MEGEITEKPVITLSKIDFYIFSLLHHIVRHTHKKVPDTREINGGNSDGDPPLPIPNREVKPVSADGTAIPSGRVGSRQLSETFNHK